MPRLGPYSPIERCFGVSYFLGSMESQINSASSITLSIAADWQPSGHVISRLILHPP